METEVEKSITIFIKETLKKESLLELLDIVKKQKYWKSGLKKYSRNHRQRIKIKKNQLS